MKKLFISILLLPVVLFSDGFDKDDYPHDDWGVPQEERKDNLLPQRDYRVVRKDAYMVGYDVNHKVPAWTIYRLSKEDLGHTLKRPSAWRYIRLFDGISARNKDYYRSGYDKGHLVPFADRKESKEIAQSTFSYINAAPQVPKFNRGIWKALEARIRKWAESYELYVITGTYFRNYIFKNKNQITSIGDNKVRVPEYWYKIVFQPGTGQLIAFHFRNVNHEYDHRDDIFEFTVPVDFIEDRARLDFLDKWGQSEMYEKHDWASWWRGK